MKLLTPRMIAIKYVHGLHDALTDSQEKKDMTKDITAYSRYYAKRVNGDSTSQIPALNLADVTQRSEPLINSDFAKYLAMNYPTTLFDVTTAIESYAELINGG